MITLTALKSVVAGVGGALVLTLFCTTFMAVEKVLFLVPFLIGVNGLFSGYRMVERLRERTERFRGFTFATGLLEGALVFFALNFLGGRLETVFFLTGLDLLLYILVAGITSYLGALLAIRYFNL